MILIFGGTTEGRYAAKVCDEITNKFYYSTKSNNQQIKLSKGIRITGGFDEENMTHFCKNKNIKLIINAAHPFATILHETIKKISEELNIPVLRYEREYSNYDNNNLIWLDNYDKANEYLNKNNINNLLALTGVKTIEKLKPYWQNHNCWFRILDRKESIDIAKENNFPMDKIIYYKKEDKETDIFKKLNPSAIITKESGISGGFDKKIIAAQNLSIPIFVIKRPLISKSFISVYGEFELKNAIKNIISNYLK